MRGLAIFLLLLGCSSASPKYLGIAPVRLQVGAYDLDVYRKGPDVQVIRTNTMAMPDAGAVAAAAVLAAEQASGCPVDQRTVKGDNSILNMRLRCPGS